MAAELAAELSPPTGFGQLSPNPATDWSALIIAIDEVLTFDNEEWVKRLAVLTAEALYLLEPEMGPRDPLMPFGHTWWRIGITDIVDIQLVPAEGQLRLCTSLIFERDAHLRNMPGAAGMRHWHDVIRMVWTARSENSLKSALDNCLPGVPERPPSPGHGLTSSKTRRPWRAEALPKIDAIGTLLKERDGFLWGGWTERTFVLLSTGTLLYYLRTPDSNGELLGDLRGVIELNRATLELHPLDEDEAAAIPGSAPSSLLLIAGIEPEPQPFYELPKRCGSLSCRGETVEVQSAWEARLRETIDRLRSDRAAGPGGGLRQRHAGSGAPASASASGPAPAPAPRRRPVPPGADPAGAAKPLATAAVAEAAGGEPALSRLHLLLLLNACWLLVRFAPDGTALWAALLVANASALYVLRPRAAAAPPDAAAAAPPEAAPAVLPPVAPPSERPKAGTLAGGVPASLWGAGDGRQFNVRCGPDYARQGRKAPSQPAMYELLGVDMVRTATRLDHAARYVQLPAPPEGGADGPLAPVLVVNIQMPLTAPPTFGGASPDGPTASIIMYFGCTAAAQREAQSATPSAGVRLMRQYCAEAPPPGESRAGNLCRYAFKVIGVLDNLDALGLPRQIARFNGKPALINKSGLLTAGEGYLEMDVGIDRFSFLAKRGLFTVLDAIRTFDIHAGFVLQGNADDELPELILGAARFPFTDYKQFGFFGA